MVNTHWRILLIDDDEDDYLLTRDLLSEIKHHSVTLDWEQGYAAARAAIARDAHDVYLLDYRLGSDNGLGLLREAVANGCAAPLILLTGQNDRAIDNEAMQAGAADYLIKGQMDASLLERAIRYAIERARTLEALRLSEERYALAARGANDGLWDWQVETNYVYYSPRWKMMLGHSEEEISNSPQELLSRVHEGDRATLKAAWDSLKKGGTEHFSYEYRIREKSGDYRWVLARGIVVRDKRGYVTRAVGSQTDITDHRRAQEQLLHDALHDNLTGLPNRTLFMDRLGFALKRARRRFAAAFGVLYVGLDRFKIVNNSLGYPSGDKLLIEISQRLSTVLRPGDTIARWGGDKFAVLLEELENTEAAIDIAERLRQVLEKPFMLDGRELFTGASIGIALSALDYSRPEEMLRDANTAMYRAKAQGNGQYRLFERSMQVKALDALQNETDLRRALERKEFVVHYQPIIDLASGDISSFEALVRWEHPQRGLVPPNDFIPLAEETGQIIPLGLWVLRESCAQLRTWQQGFAWAKNLSLCVNLSVSQLSHPDLVKQIDQALQEFGLRPGNLKLEITESGVMQDVESAIKVLNQLGELGVEFSVDDFGTGQSSLGYLQRLPIKFLKIDRSFISRMKENSRDGELVCTIIEMARKLGLDVVAEGIETAEQLALLKGLQCQYGQGYYFSKPIAGELVEKLLPQFRQRRAA